MSAPPTAKSMSFAEPEARPVLVPAGNKARSVELRKPIVKSKVEKTKQTAHGGDEAKAKALPSPEKMRRNGSTATSILRQRQPNFSMNASCSSDASSDSSLSRASTGRISRRSGNLTTPSKKKQLQQGSPKFEKIEMKEGNGSEGVVVEGGVVKKRCAWVTSNTDPLYTAFHDEEWGLPVHDDKKLFELLSFSTALAELSWPVILSKRHTFRDVFLDFDPVAVSKLNEKKIVAPGCPANSLLSEVKLRNIIENARQICKIIGDFGSFDKYIWGFVNYKPTVGNFRYPRQVPIKTSKADTISKDMVRKGFRGVGPTVIYSFMQAVGITNDHLISCFRHHDCVIAGDLRDKNEGITAEKDGKLPEDIIIQLDLARNIDDMSLSR